MESLEEGSISQSLMLAITWIIKAGFVLGGVAPYIPQYLEVRKTKCTEGFSLYVCLTLLIANILRILFWFGIQFELTLLIQSILMIIVMMALIHLCVNVQHGTQNMMHKERVFQDFEYKYFWNWTDFQSYLEFILSFTTVTSFITYIFLESDIFIQCLGFVALLTESLLGAPQFYKNLCTRSTCGMSKKMVAMWLCGDTFKTGYFYVTRAPPQFAICGCLQIGIDLAIIGQCFIYRKNAKL